MNAVLFGIITLIICGFAVIGWMIRRVNAGRVEKDALNRAQMQVDFLQSRLNETSALNERLSAENGALKADTAALKVELEQERKHLNDKIGELKQVREEFTLQFKLISSDILKSQGADFAKTQQETLGSLLTPLKEQIDSFKNRMEAIHQVNTTDKGKMDEQLHQLLEMNKTLSDDARDLTNALKGNAKYQGDWGEMQLERVFEASGFLRNVHYRTQENFKDDEGASKRPDYVIELPGGRRLIIDCKVSMNAYLRYVRAETPEDRKRFLAEHVQALRNHIRDLSSKNYQGQIKEMGLDYVFMFIPVEHAYIEALSAESDIYEQAYRNNIMVTTASSLLPILRTVENMWRLEKQNRNVQQIAETGGKLYDKLAGFVADMQAVDRALDRAKSSCTDAFRKLSEGNGNALRLALKLKQQGAKTSKELPLPADADDDEEAETLPALPPA